MTHSLDFDDVHEAAIMHPGVISIPTALAAGELAGGMNGKEFVKAVALGADMICRMGLATRPGDNIHKYGWHLTTLNAISTPSLKTELKRRRISRKEGSDTGIEFSKYCVQSVSDSVESEFRESIQAL